MACDPQTATGRRWFLPLRSTLESPLRVRRRRQCLIKYSEQSADMDGSGNLRLQQSGRQTEMPKINKWRERDKNVRVFLVVPKESPYESIRRPSVFRAPKKFGISREIYEFRQNWPG